LNVQDAGLFLKAASSLIGPAQCIDVHFPERRTTADEIDDPDSLSMELLVNGDVRQGANTCQLIKGVRELIAWASEWYTLYPGDVIFTGTPEGVAPIALGDVLTASIAKVGSMTVAVRAAAVPSHSLNTVLS
jgi:2-keto-4-pentenoate hydratase/2-oxohepta-3-ene-1,7-dioic acid hydratase in catechol pathway